MSKNLSLSTAILSLAILPALALANDKSASSSDKSASSAKSTTLTGCLSGPKSDGAYTLKTGTKQVEVGGDTELKNHVGHEVKLTGAWAKASDIGEKEASSAKGEKHEQHFKVTNIQHVSETCSSKDSKSDAKSQSQTDKKSGH